jgi:hypothetical protein
VSSQVPGKSIRSVNYGTRVARLAATLPATGNQTIFTVTGRVLITTLIGEVTTATGATVTNLKVTAVSTVGSIATDLTANAAVTSLAVGNLYGISGIAATAANIGSAVQQSNELVVQPGVIRITTDATNTGAMTWTVTYVPLDDGASIVAA